MSLFLKLSLYLFCIEFHICIPFTSSHECQKCDLCSHLESKSHWGCEFGCHVVLCVGGKINMFVGIGFFENPKKRV